MCCTLLLPTLPPTTPPLSSTPRSSLKHLLLSAAAVVTSKGPGIWCPVQSLFAGFWFRSPLMRPLLVSRLQFWLSLFIRPLFLASLLHPVSFRTLLSDSSFGCRIRCC